MAGMESLRTFRSRDALDVVAEVISGPSEWREKAEDHRQMARAAIRVALRHGIPDKEILAEYEVVKRLEDDQDV